MQFVSSHFAYLGDDPSITLGVRNFCRIASNGPHFRSAISAAISAAISL